MLSAPVLEADGFEVLGSGYGLPEGPVFDRATGDFLFSDASAGGVWRYPAAGEPEQVVTHRRGIGGLALHRDGGYVVAGRNCAWKRGDQTVVLAEVDLPGPLARFNDLTVSPQGRIYAGSIDYDPTHAGQVALGSLLMIDLDGTVRKVSDGLHETNGLAFSPDGHRLYHVDTGPKVLRVYEVGDDGSLSAWTALHQWDEGLADGMAAAEDGSLWIAVAEVGGEGFIDVLEPNGELRMRVRMPNSKVKSLCFGGPDLRSVYVTLGGDATATLLDGFVGVFRSEIPGLPVAYAAVALGTDG
jgi:gluconolactonase